MAGREASGNGGFCFFAPRTLILLDTGGKMQYFVSAENSSYFYWQLELLIESFLMQGMEKQLVIGLAENDDQKIRGYSHNLVKYGRKFMLPNEGRSSGYLPLNRINSIRYALAYKIIEFPFVLIHADMILKNPISLSEDDEKYGVIVNNFDELSGTDSKVIEDEVDSLVERLVDERKVEKKDITRIPFFSAPVVFNKPMEYFADPFFTKVQAYETQLVNTKGAEFPCERAAWELSLTESFQHVGIKGNFMAAPMVYEGENINFIHYRSGIPPVFHKKFFRYEHGVFHTSMGPYETIMEHNPTVNTNYVHQVIRSYNKRANR